MTKIPYNYIEPKGHMEELIDYMIKNQESEYTGSIIFNNKVNDEVTETLNCNYKNIGKGTIGITMPQKIKLNVEYCNNLHKVIEMIKLEGYKIEEVTGISNNSQKFDELSSNADGTFIQVKSGENRFGENIEDIFGKDTNYENLESNISSFTCCDSHIKKRRKKSYY